MAGKAWEGTQLLPENRTTNDIVRSSKLDGTGGNGFYIDAVNIALRDIQRTLNQAQALLASSGAAITAGQGYIIDNGGVAQLPTGISLMRVVGINLPAGAKGFSANAQAYVTAISSWVPCTYDVATNKVFCKYIAWAGNISQTGGGDAVIDLTFVNLLGETPVFDASAVGVLDILTTTWNWPQHKTILFSPRYFDGSNLWSPSLQWGAATSLTLYMVKGDGSLVDDMYVNQYIELSVIISNL